MGKTLQPVTARVNRSLPIETQEDRLMGDPGAIVLRESLERSGIVDWMTHRLNDPRRPMDVTHDLASQPTCSRFTAMMADGGQPQGAARGGSRDGRASGPSAAANAPGA